MSLLPEDGPISRGENRSAFVLLGSVQHDQSVIDRLKQSVNSTNLTTFRGYVPNSLVFDSLDSMDFQKKGLLFGAGFTFRDKFPDSQEFPRVDFNELFTGWTQPVYSA